MVQSPDKKNEINFPIIFKKHSHFSYCLKNSYEAKISNLIHLLLLLLLFFFFNQLEASDRRDPAVSPEKIIINYSRNNRKKYFFQGREIEKIQNYQVQKGPENHYSKKKLQEPEK